MGALIESQNLEAEIADCCRAIYWATEPDVAMRSWARLRELTALKTEAEMNLFVRETMNGKFSNRPA
jgi:hypothetical protein